MFRMLLAFVIPIFFVLVFLLKICFCIVAYSYIYTQLAYRRGLPKQADGRG